MERGLNFQYSSMSTEKTEALVIRVADFSESSRVVTFFTRDWGKIATVAKGGRRLKGPFEAALDLLTACRIVFIRKSSSSLDILTEAQLISRFRTTGRNLINLYGGYYIAELLAGFTEEYDPHPELYDTARATLGQLESDEKPHLAIVRFELATLRESGQLPEFEHCLICNDVIISESAHGNQTYAYWVSGGGLICPRCRNEEYTNLNIHPGTIAILRKLAGRSESSFQRLEVSPQQLAEMRQLTSASISHVLGKRPKMLRYIKT